MSKAKHAVVMVSLIILLLLANMLGCVSTTPESTCGALKVELDRANAELAKLKAQLSEAKAELEKARGEMAKVKSASLEALLRQRRSVREYTDAPLTREEVMKLLWAGQGITRAWGGRTAPSAGALYPLELYLVAGKVEDMAPGVYKYRPEKNSLTRVKEGDVRASLALASLGQSCVANGAINIVIAAVYRRTEVKYGSRGERYVHIEVGHAAQNICLQATALGLGLVTVGAFDDAEVARILDMPRDETPLYVLPVGRIK